MAKARDNTKIRCSVPGCGKPRAACFSVYCDNHMRVYQRHGHWNGKTVPSKSWALERNEVLAIIEVNPDHPGFASALQFIHTLLHTTNGRRSIDAELKRLRDAEVTPKAIFVELAACFIWMGRTTSRLPDMRAENHLLSDAVLRLAPRARTTMPDGSRGFPSRVSIAAVNFIGKTLRDTCSLVLAESKQAVLQRAENLEKNQHAAFMAARTPFILPAA